MNKKITLLLLLVSLVFASCSKSSSEPNPGPNPLPPAPTDESPKTLTVQNLKGEWEVYNFQKRATGPNQLGGKYDATFRYYESDQHTYSFDGEGNYKERDPRGTVVAYGTYTVLEPKPSESGELPKPSQILLVVNMTISPPGTAPTNKIHNVTAFTQYRLTMIDDFPIASNKEIKVTDTRVYRNKQTLGNQAPGVNKEMIDINKLIGEWTITGGVKSTDGVAEDASGFVGTKFQFKADKTFKETLTNGSVKEGIYVIGDDLVHLFWEKEPETEAGTRMSTDGASLSLVEANMEQSNLHMPITDDTNMSTRAIVIDPLLYERSVLHLQNWKEKKGKLTVEEYNSYTLVPKDKAYLVNNMKRITLEKTK